MIIENHIFLFTTIKLFYDNKNYSIEKIKNNKFPFNIMFFKMLYFFTMFYY